MLKLIMMVMFLLLLCVFKSFLVLLKFYVWVVLIVNYIFLVWLVVCKSLRAIWRRFGVTFIVRMFVKSSLVDILSIFGLMILSLLL